jgi:diacylglycerol kinase (ATP)
MKKFILSVGFALNGLKYAFTSQQNFRIQMLCVTPVLAMELFDTGVETLTHPVSPGYNNLAGHVKDMSAAVILIMAIFTFITGIIIFFQKFLLRLHAA